MQHTEFHSCTLFCGMQVLTKEERQLDLKGLLVAPSPCVLFCVVVLAQAESFTMANKPMGNNLPPSLLMSSPAPNNFVA